MKSWKKIYTTPNPVRAEIVRSILEDREIPAVVVNKKDSMYNLGNFEVQVSNDLIIRALKIVNEEVNFD